MKKMLKKSTSKNNDKHTKRNRIKRIIKQVLWFIFITAFVISLQFLLSLAMFALINPVDFDTRGAKILAVLSALMVSVLLGPSLFFLHNTETTLLRWTRLDLFALLPLVFIWTGLFVLLLDPHGVVENETATNNLSKNQSTLKVGVAGNYSYIDNMTFEVAKLVEFSNKARADNQVAALTLNPTLNTTAQKKCDDMVARNYWAHNTPDGVEPWQLFTQIGYKYDAAGENLAYGFRSENDVVTGWMSSPGHRKNLLNGDYTEVGFGICKSDNYVNRGKQIIIVQHFAKPASVQKSKTYTQPAPKPYVAPVCTKTPIPYTIKYEDVSYLYVGETSEYGGYDGYVQTCTADSTGYKPSDFTIQPIEKTVLRGTKPRPEPVVPPPAQ